jgi:chitinase
VTRLTLAFREQLPKDSYYITHAPVAPWFTTDEATYPHGAYRAIAQNTGDAIDWFNIQYYNQGNMYSSCEQLITQSPAGEYPHTSIWEIHTKSNISLEKLVIGKPARKDDVGGGEGYMSAEDEEVCLKEAFTMYNWTAGAMFWEFHGYTESSNSTGNGDQLTPSELIKIVRGNTFALDSLTG